tara:strand:+ start:262 stop:759 length:498 start_codon:yes stop_codon:yes gene_type:complete
MIDPTISISFIDYNNKENIRILNACLSKWFENPKILHFTDPKMNYPFNINKWISLSYKGENVKTLILKIDNWIIGHLSMKIWADKNSVHLFHLIVDPKYLRKGYAKNLIRYAENIIKIQNKKKITLHVVKKNTIAKQLYQSMGYLKLDKNNIGGNLKMEKIIDIR